MELKGTRHLVLAWVPIILAAMIIGGIVAVAVNTILRQLGLDIPYISEFIGSLAGALALSFVLKKHWFHRYYFHMQNVIFTGAVL